LVFIPHCSSKIKLPFVHHFGPILEYKPTCRWRQVLWCLTAERRSLWVRGYHSSLKSAGKHPSPHWTLVTNRKTSPTHFNWQFNHTGALYHRLRNHSYDIQSDGALKILLGTPSNGWPQARDMALQQLSGIKYFTNKTCVERFVVSFQGCMGNYLWRTLVTHCHCFRYLYRAVIRLLWGEQVSFFLFKPLCWQISFRQVMRGSHCPLVFCAHVPPSPLPKWMHSHAQTSIAGRQTQGPREEAQLSSGWI